MTADSKGDTQVAGTLRSLLPRRTRRLLLGIFMLSLAAFLASATGQFRSIDDENLFYTAHSLTSLRPDVDVCPHSPAPDFVYTRGSHGCTDPSQAQLQNSYQKGRHGKFVSKYGIGEPIAAAPFFVTGRIVASVLSDGSDGSCRGPTAVACCRTVTNDAAAFRANCQGNTHDMIVQTTTLFTNSFLTAITLALVIIVSLQLGAPLRGAALIGLVFGFGSFAFAYAKTLSTEPGTAMCLIAAVMFAIEASRTGRTRALVACGVVAGAALFFRVTGAVFLPVLGVWLLAIGYRRHDLRSAVRYGALLSLGAEPGTAMCLIAAVMFAIEAARTGRARTLVACGLAAGDALLFRSTAAVFLPVLGVWFLVVGYRKRDLRTAVRYGALFSAGAVAALAVLVMFNAWRYGSALSFGYGQTGAHLHGIRARGALVTGIWGLWLSPGKSIFLYAPFVLLAVAGIIISIRRLPAEMSLLIALVAANTVFFARVRFWSGDWAWGPRYMIIVLPCLAVMCAPLVNMVRWRRALAALAGIGFLLPGALGVLVNFNTFYLQAQKKLGANFRNSIYHNWSWQPIGRHISVLKAELGNLGKPFGLLYLTGKPRLDIWWLDDRWWLSQHPRRIAAAVVMLLFIGALAVGGAVTLRRAMRGPVAAETPPGSRLAPE